MSETNPGFAGHDDELRAAIATVRRHWRRRVLLEGALGVVIAALVAVLAGMGLHALLGSSHTTIAVVRIVGYVVLIAAIARFLLQPAFRRIDDDRLALYVEERTPELRQTFLSAVQQLDTDAAAGASPALARRVMARAIAEIHRLDDGATLERPRARMAVVRLVGAVALAVTAVAFGPTALRDMARLLFVPWSEAAAAAIPAMSVSPGNISVPRGAALDVRAELRGFSNGNAEIVIRPDSATEWTRIPMVRDSTGSGYVTRLFDVARNTSYYVEADGIRSATYRITVTDLPTVKQLGLELRYPAYTGLPPQKIDNGGDVVAVTGTTAILTIDATLPVRGGSLRFDDGTSLPLTLTADGHLTGSFRVAHDGFYRVDLIGSDGAQVPGTVQHSVEALVDHPPMVRIEKPGRDTRVGSVEEVPIAIRATDDYGVRGVELHFAVNGGADRTIVLTDSVHGASTDVRAAHTVFLEDFSLKPGDLVAYHAVARDGAGHTGSSDIYFLEVRAYGKDYHQADAAAGGGGGGGGQNPGTLTERQRQIVVGTFNWERDSAATPDRERRENATTLAISQGKLRADAVTLTTRMASRDVAQDDSGFVIVKAAIDSAVIAMAAAENGLGKHVMSEALPPEQRALQMLQRADEAYRDVQVQMGGRGSGGGGGGQSNSQDLADLFELQTDKLKNQYEAVQSQSSAEQQQQQALDSTAERLKELTTRVQQANQREQQALDSLQRRLPPQQSSSSGGGGGGGGGQSSQGGRSGQSGAQSLSRGNATQKQPTGGGATGSQQRAVAQQIEEEAHRLERLSREQNKPDLAQTAQQLQQAADQMRQAAAGATEQGRQALSQLQAAAKNVDDARTSAATQGAQDLAQRAQQLSAEQQQIAKDVAALPSASGADKENRTRDLEMRKDTLASRVQQLQGDAQKLASQVRQDQPATANSIQNAAGEIRDKDLVRNIDWSRTMLRGENVSPEYQRTIENDISDNLNNVANQLAGAAGQGSQQRQQQLAQNNALNQARDLVRDLESLQQRVIDSAGRSQGQQSGSQPGQGQSAQAPQGQAQQGRGQQGQGQPGQAQQGRGQQGQGQQGQGQQGQQGQGQQGQGQQGQGQQGQGQQGQGRGQGQPGQQGQGQGQGGGQPGDGRQGNPNGNRGGGGAGSAPPAGANGNAMTNDPRQFGREVGLRREEAESLRGNLAKQGVNVAPLDHVIDEMRQLERAGKGDPGKTDGLQSAIIAGLKSFEFDLWRHYNIGADNKPALGASGDVPPEFRSLVEEYYRSLARPVPVIKPPQ